LAAESCPGTSGFSDAEMGEGATGTGTKMGPAERGNALASASARGHDAPIATLWVSSLNELLPLWLARKARILSRSSG
jgi:hypothetical protein